MWIKVVAAVLILTGAEGIGFCICQDARCRLYHEQEQKQMVLYIEKEVGFLHKPMKEIFESICYKLKPPYRDFLSDVACEMEEESGKSLDKIWYENVDKMEKSKNVKRDYFAYLTRIGECFNSDDNELLISMLKLVNNELEEDIGQLRRNMKERTKLARSLSLLGGIFWIVMLI